MYSLTVTKSEEAENESAPNSGAAPFGRPGAELKLKLRSIQADGDGEGSSRGTTLSYPGPSRERAFASG